MDTALYIRVSTMQQRPDLQADSLRRYAKRDGLEITAEYLDVAVSGRKEGRPQLQALMRAARRHAFDCVLVWKFDRFARSVAHLLSALDEFHHLGIGFISVQDQVDTKSPMGKGGCFRGVDFLSEGPPEFIAVDEKTYHQVMHLLCLGKTDRPTH